MFSLSIFNTHKKFSIKAVQEQGNQEKNKFNNHHTPSINQHIHTRHKKTYTSNENSRNSSNKMFNAQKSDFIIKQNSGTSISQSKQNIKYQAKVDITK